MTAKTFFLKVKAADTNQYLKSSWLQACVRHVVVVFFFLINHFPSKMWKKSHSSQFGFKMRNRPKSVHSFCLNTHRTAASGTAWPSTCSISRLFTSFSVDWRQHTATAECCHILLSTRRQKHRLLIKINTVWSTNFGKGKEKNSYQKQLFTRVKVKLCACVKRAAAQGYQKPRSPEDQCCRHGLCLTWCCPATGFLFYLILPLHATNYQMIDTHKKYNYPCNFISCIMLVLVRFWSFW